MLVSDTVTVTLGVPVRNTKAATGIDSLVALVAVGGREVREKVCSVDRVSYESGLNLTRSQASASASKTPNFDIFAPPRAPKHFTPKPRSVKDFRLSESGPDNTSTWPTLPEVAGSTSLLLFFASVRICRLLADRF